MSSLRQILIHFHYIYLCDYTGQSQNLSQFLFGSGLGSCGRSVNYLRKYMTSNERGQELVQSHSPNVFTKKKNHKHRLRQIQISLQNNFTLNRGISVASVIVQPERRH